MVAAIGILKAAASLSFPRIRSLTCRMGSRSNRFSALSHAIADPDSANITSAAKVFAKTKET
jgi:hypothetical protein